MFYKVITECGHLGAGKGFERVWFFAGRDPLSILNKARTLPGVKRKDTSLAIKLVKRVTRGEYLKGKRKSA